MGAALFRLIRISSFATAPSDVFAGYFFILGTRPAAEGDLPRLALLAAAAMCAYFGGLVLNDLVDLEADRRFRPRRPLPGGAVSRTAAGVLLGAVALLALVLALLAGRGPLLAVLLLLATVVAYDLRAKRETGGAVVFMALCRVQSFLLGVWLAEPSAWISALGVASLYAIYIGAITVVGRSEAGSTGRPPTLAGLLGAVVPLSLLPVLYVRTPGPGWLVAAVPLTVLALRLFRRALEIATFAAGPSAKRYVKTAVLGILLLNAAHLLNAERYLLGVGLIALHPLSGILARRFSPS